LDRGFGGLPGLGAEVLKKPPVVFAGSAASKEQFPLDGLPEVAFLGRSNVGKSSLLNALAGVKNLARVSSDPGRTRLINFFRVGNEFYLVDLPGYGYAKVPETMRRSWEALVTSYLSARTPLRLGVFLVDSRHEPGANDQILRSYLDQVGLPYLLAATKADKLTRGELARRVRALEGGLGIVARAVCPVSAMTGTGLPELWKAVRAEIASRPRETEANATRTASREA
jgi:GTP-binding protein